MSEVLLTAKIRVELHQRSTGPGKLIVGFSDVASRDAIMTAIKSAADE